MTPDHNIASNVDLMDHHHLQGGFDNILAKAFESLSDEELKGILRGSAYTEFKRIGEVTRWMAERVIKLRAKQDAEIVECGYCHCKILDTEARVGDGFEPTCSRECLGKWNAEYPKRMEQTTQDKEKNGK